MLFGQSVLSLKSNEGSGGDSDGDVKAYESAAVCGRLGFRRRRAAAVACLLCSSRIDDGECWLWKGWGLCGTEVVHFVACKARTCFLHIQPHVHQHLK